MRWKIGSLRSSLICPLLLRCADTLLVPFEATVSAKISMGQWFACEQACVISGSEREQRSGLREFEVLPKAIFNRTFVVFKNISNPLIS
jgi:hypothetical protein